MMMLLQTSSEVKYFEFAGVCYLAFLLLFNKKSCTKVIRVTGSKLV